MNRSRIGIAFAKFLALTVAAAFSSLSSAAQEPQASQPSSQQAVAVAPADSPYLNPKLPLEQRVDDLISRMTLEEKISQLGHTASAIPRLHVPQYNWWNEGLHGVARAGIATVFPQAIGMAATFDEPLMHQVAGVISTEFRAKYYATLHPDGSTDWYRGLTVWSPNINIFRDPRWGRGQETYGEDPFLTSQLGLAFVTGLQGDDPRFFKTVSTPKHFAVHSGPESTRHSVDVTASHHDMEDTYFPAFRATVMQGKAESVMCAYNSLNGQPACANTDLLQQHLRKDWGFQGYVVSDCGAVTDIYVGHHFAPTAEAGVAAAFKAGMDLICGDYRNGMSTEHAAILNAVHQGLLTEADLDRSLRRLFTARFRLGMFDPPGTDPYSRISPAENDTDAHRQLALRMARESIVLLKNSGHLLPLKQEPATIAVIGPNADSLDAIEGNYNGTPSKPVTILAGIRQRFLKSKILYEQATGLIGPVTEPIPAESLCVDAACSEHGLKGDYFANMKLEGSPVMTRTDPMVNFAWGDTGISTQLLKNYSVRWTGFLVPSESGEFTLGFTGQDGYRLSVDGNLLVQDWTLHHPASTLTQKIHLEKDHPYPIQIEYFQDVRSSECRLIWSLPDDEGRKAVAAASNANLVVLVMGLSPRVEGEEMHVKAEGFSGGDRTSIDLPAPQQKLIQRVLAAGKPTVLVLLNGSALAVNWANANIPAILEAWYPGEEGGTAVAEALAGDFSPAGRLPVTFYKSTEQLPPFDDYSMANRTYRYFHGDPLFPFGYGLSYTSFSYSHPRIDHKKISAQQAVTISVEVQNTGSIASDEVVQLYMTHPGVAGAPLRALEGFQRIHLDRDEKRTVKFVLKGRDLSTVDESGVRRIVPGDVQVWIGGGQPVATPGLEKPAGVSAQFSIASGATLPD
ncbi:MAG TPA: glycoside hydrolase family 3 C-terminal domain-containing protein [Candidatus Acidoferrum sp.]|nr:glycoside hydrolase family 3 C-terminal domain-containing protein [Candidatus Acidoferrum sp.]